MTGAANPTPKCLLHVPHRRVGHELVRKMNMDADSTLKAVGRSLDNNFQEVERWVDRFYKECVCDCAGGGGT